MGSRRGPRGRGFLLGCTAGRTTLNGEGLQHQDGHSLLLASTVPSVAAYDPAFSYEVAAIVEDGIRRMTGPESEDRFWYLTLYNENYPMPSLPPILRGRTHQARLHQGDVPVRPRRGLHGRGCSGRPPGRRRASVLFSGSAWQGAVEARRMLAADWGVDADLWSVTSYKALREEAMAVERWNRLHPDDTERVPYVAEQLATSAGPVVAVSDFMRAVPDQISRWCTGGVHLSRHRRLRTIRYQGGPTALFEVDAAHVVVAVLHALAAERAVPARAVTDALTRYDVDTTSPDPWLA